MDSKEFEKFIVDTQQNASKEIDRLLIYIPSGALVFTMGFIKDIIPNWEVAKYVILIKISWILYASTVLSALFSLFAMHWVLYLMQEKNSNSRKKALRYWTLPKIITNLSIFLLIIGIFMSVLFIIVNI